MNRFETALVGALGAAEIVEGTGCRARDVSLNGDTAAYTDTDGGSTGGVTLSADQCWDKLDSSQVDMQDDEFAVRQVGYNDASVSYENQFNDQFDLIQENLQDSIRAIGALGNPDRDNYTTDSYSGAIDFQTETNQYGNEESETESSVMDLRFNMNDAEGLDGYNFTVVFTDPSCTKQYSNYQSYDIYDYGFDNGYYVEEYTQ